MLVIPISSSLYQTLNGLAKTERMVFMTGLPGTGKSLLIQQLALIARQAGRQVHLMQWEMARKAFETADNLAKYPEIDGVTDPAIRKAVGKWARGAVLAWHQQHPDPAHMLIGELPLIGNRLVELIEPHDDEAEPLLRAPDAKFVIPVPSWEVREVIEEARARTIAEPQHAQEKLDAAPNVLRMLWQDVNKLAREMGLTKARPETAYNPYIYGGVYEALLQHRQAQTLLIDQVLRPTKSVYALDVVTSQLQAAPHEVTSIMVALEADYTPDGLRQSVENWHAIVTQQPKRIDPGPELRLPMPEDLAGIVEATTLTAVQTAALKAIVALRLEAPPSEMLPALDRALAVLQEDLETAETTTNIRKFDIYDSYFNVTRSNDQKGHLFLVGMLQAYRNALEDLEKPPFTLTVVEVPMLRIALETTLRLFGI